MSRLTDPMLGEIARKSGFTGDHLTTAVAVSIAASGGNPGYDHPVWPGPVAHYKGLYGLDVCQWPDIPADDLHSPWVAGKLAYELTKRYGWGWNPTARAGTHYPYLERAAVAAGMLPHREQASEPIMIGSYQKATQRRFEQQAAARDAIDYGWRL